MGFDVNCKFSNNNIIFPILNTMNSSDFISLPPPFSLSFQQNQIFLKLLELNFDPDLALILLKSYPEDITFSDFLNKFISDENGVFDHVFIASTVTPNLCSICNNIESKHVKLPQEQEEKISSIHKTESDSNEEQKSQRSSQIKSMINRSKIRTDCKICFDKVPDQYLFKINSINHEICIDCLKSYITNEIIKGHLFPLKCPHCLIENLDLSLIRQFVDQTTFLKYQRLVINYAIVSNKNFLYCPGCFQLIMKEDCKNEKRLNLIENTESKKLACPVCSIEICEACYREKHNPTKCETMALNEINFFGKTTDVQRCPNCKAYVEKMKGCNHITCRCLYEFCWLCNGQYTSLHYINDDPKIDPTLVCPYKRKKQDILKLNDEIHTNIEIQQNIANSTHENIDLIEKINHHEEFGIFRSLPQEEFMRIDEQRQNKKIKWICMVLLFILFLPVCLIVFPVYFFIKDITMSQCWIFYFRNRNCLIKGIIVVMLSIVGACFLPILWLIMLGKMCMGPKLEDSGERNLLLHEENA